MDTIRELAMIVSLISGAVLAFAGVLSLFYRWTLRARLCRLETVLTLVEFHLEPNGYENEAHPDDRDQPVRKLLLRSARRGREIAADLDLLKTRTAEHETQHIRHDPNWPA